jgi:hypothetical protein
MNGGFLKRLHEDERGGESVEKIMWLGAGAVVLGILITAIFPPIRAWLEDALRTITSFRVTS